MTDDYADPESFSESSVLIATDRPNTTTVRPSSSLLLVLEVITGPWVVPYMTTIRIHSGNGIILSECCHRR